MAVSGVKCLQRCNIFVKIVSKNVKPVVAASQFHFYNAQQFQSPILKIPSLRIGSNISRYFSDQPIKENESKNVEKVESNKENKEIEAVKETEKKEQQKMNEEEAKKREQSWRAMKFGFILFGSSFATIGGYLIYQLGSPRKDEEGNIIQDEYSSLPLWLQFLKRFWKELNYYQKMIQEPSRDKLLPDPLTYPYLQPPYTLVLEMSGMLVHPEWTYQTGWRFKKRPGVDHFLEQVAPPMFEIVVFTADQGMTVFPILDALDPNGYIMYRLVRDATHFIDGHHVKDLSCLNRDLKRVIVVDWNADSVKLHRENTIIIPKWKGNDDDLSLVDLAQFLRTIALAKVDDVRETLQYYSQFDDPIQAFRENQRKLMEQLEEKQRQEKEKPNIFTSRGSWSPSFLSKKPQ